MHKELVYSAWCDRFYIEPDLRDQWADIESAEYIDETDHAGWCKHWDHWSVHVDGPLKALLSGHTLAGTIGVEARAEALALAWKLRTERAPLPEAACCVDRLRRGFTVPVNIVSRCTANEVLKQAGLPKAF